MAKARKRKASNTLVWILMGLLVVGLAGFGTARFTGGAQSVASVGDREVSANEYARGLNLALVNLERQTGQQLSLQQAQLFGASQQVLGELMIAAALDNETDSIGFSAGDERLARRVGELPGFVGIDGKFDRVVYQSTLDRAGLTIADFEAQLRDELARQVLESAVTGGIDAPRAATRAFLDYLATKRDVSFVTLGEADLSAPIAAPDDSQLRGYHNEHADQFFVPETKVMTYAWLTPNMLVDGISVDDSVLRAAYDARSDEFNRPERRLVERLVFGDQAEAEAAAARVEAGEIDFPGLVAERGLDLADIDLGDATQAQLGAAGDAVFR
jgi:peptidyl-prolyl cis-trans isomerase D